MLESLRIVQGEPQRRQNLTRLTTFAHKQMAELGLRSIGDGMAPIVPILQDSEESAVRVASELLDAGWFVPAIRPPTVTEGTSRLRLSLTVGHSMEQVKQVLGCIRKTIDTTRRAHTTT
jgi:7-keto-8-aminopelargonate synthetase-like enzyme